MPRLRAPVWLWLLLGIELVYLATLFPGVGGRINTGDSAKFQFIGRVLGVSHPPGNPLYLLLDAAFVRLPLPGRDALRVNALSSLFAIGALFFVYRMLHTLAGTRAAVCGTLALAFGPLFWTFATEAEVYSLHSCLLAGSCDAALRFAHTRQRGALVACSAWALLALTNHATSAVMVVALVALVFAARAWSSALDRRSALAIAAIAFACVALYAYLPLRAAAAPRYSELATPVTAKTVERYLTADAFQQQFGGFALRELVRERVPQYMQPLQTQWLWPLLLLVPIGLLEIRARCPLFFWYLGLCLAGFSAFVIGYGIPDPAGLYIPIVTLLALPMGVALRSRPGQSWESHALLAFAFAVATPAATVHLDQLRRVAGRELSYRADGKELFWDLDDVFARIPEGSTLAVPCSHYGCTQVLNYYRFADPVPKRRGITLARPRDVPVGYFSYGEPLALIKMASAKKRVLCTLRESDAAAMRRRGATVRKLEREPKPLAGKLRPRAQIYCSVPSTKS